MSTTPAPDALLAPREVAAICGVTPKTVTRWANAGKLPAVRTPGCHRRFRYQDVARLLEPAS